MHTSSVNSVAFSPDGQHIVSGSSDQRFSQTILSHEAQLRSARVSSGRIEMRARGLENKERGVNAEDDEEYTPRHSSGSSV